MLFQFDVSGPAPMSQQPVPDAVPANELELLREILEVQKEQLALSRAVAMANDGGQRWRGFLARWADEYPGMAAGCKYILPQLERAYMELMREMTERLGEDPEAIDNEFTLGEFLDKFGMKIGQLGQILNMVTPLAEAYVPPQSAQPAEDAGKEES